MERKITKRGHCTASINLPRDWIKKNNLKFNDTINLIENESEIIITPTKKNKTKIINLEKLNNWQHHYFSQFYQAGYDILIFINISNKTKKEIKSILWNYPGSNMKKEEENILIISIDKVYSTYSFSVKKAIENCIKLIEIIMKDKNEDSLKSLRKIYQFSELATRQINLEIQNPNLNYLNLVTYNLTQIGLLSYTCLEFINKGKINLNPNLFKQFELISNSLKYSNKIFSFKDINLEEHLELRHKLHYESLRDFNYFNKFKNEEVFLIEKIVNIFRLINGINSRVILYFQINKL